MKTKARRPFRKGKNKTEIKASLSHDFMLELNRLVYTVPIGRIISAKNAWTLVSMDFI